MTSSSSDRRQGTYGSAAFKVPCRVATTANITLSGEQTIDGVAVVADDRVLVKNQTTGSENGIYVCDTGTWSRARDFDGTNDCLQGTFVYVVSGTTNSDTIFRLTTASPVIGTSSLSFSATGASALQNVSAFIQTLLDDASASAARSTLGAIGLTGNDTITGTKDLTGATVTVATASVGDDDTSVASTAMVQAAVAARQAVNDAGVTVTDAMRTIVFTALSAARTVTLPAASGIKAGRQITIIDGSGSASSTNTISLAPNGTDTIAGSNTTQVAINIPRGRAVIVCNGSTGWDVEQWSVIYTNSLSGDVTLNNTGSYFDGPTVVQGSVGTWMVGGHIVAVSTANSIGVDVKLTDGTSVFASAEHVTPAANSAGTLSLPPVMVSAPAGSLRISVKDKTDTSGKILYNQSGNSKDSTITAWRIA